MTNASVATAQTTSLLSRPGALSRRRKAAMVVQILLAEGQALSLTKLPEEVQLDLTRELGSLRVIDKTTMEAVAREFLSDLEAVGLTAPGGIEAALNALRDRISPAAAARLRAEQTMGSNDPWAVIAAMESPEIVIIMEGESTEIAAVALSKIPVAKAAEVLGLLPGERARRIAFAVSQTGAVSPDSVARIGTALATAYGDKPLPAFTESPEARVGEILNSSPAATRDAVLEALGTDDPEFAEGVRKSIFTFANIPARVGPTDLPKVIRLVDGEVLVTALAAAFANDGEDKETAEYLLSNISQRMADQLREELGERGKPKRAEGEAAMSEVIAGVRKAVEQGDIKLIEEDEEEEE